MAKRWRFAGWLALAPLAFVAVAGRTQEATYADLEPIFQQRCTMCHSGAAAARGLRLDTFAGVIAGSERGSIVAAGDPAASELVRRLRGDAQPRMPITGPPFLADSEIALFEQWVAMGAPEGPVVAGKPPEGAATAPAGSAAETPDHRVTFAQVAPIFATRCAKCHTARGQMGAPPEGYRLDSYEAALAAGERARILPGNPAASELMRRVRGLSSPRMPFDGPPYLTDKEILLIERWIADGARNSRGDPAPVPVGAEIRLEGRLTGRWQVDDVPFVVTDKSRIRKSPSVGDRVRVRGRVLDDGSIWVERLRAD